MKLLLTDRNLIVGIGSEIEYGVWGNVKDLPSWKINQNSYVMDNNFTVLDIGDTVIPTYVVEDEYYYIDGEFKPKGASPNEYEERIDALEKEVEKTYDEMANAITEGVNEV